MPCSICRCFLTLPVPSSFSQGSKDAPSSLCSFCVLCGSAQVLESDCLGSDADSTSSSLCVFEQAT